MIRDTNFYKTFLRMTFFLSAQNLIILFIALVDNVMLGSFSEEALSGAALVNQIQFILQCILLAIGTGVSLLSSQYWGKQKSLQQENTDTTEMQSVRNAGNIGAVLCIFIAALFFLIATIIPRQCLELFSKDQAIIEEGIKYLSIIRFSYLFFALVNIILAILRSVEIVYIGTVSSTISLILKVILNYILIYGNLGAPRLGISGAALATFAAHFVEFAVVFWFLWKKDNRIRFLYYKPCFNKDMFWDMAKLTAPIMLSNGLWGIYMGLHTGILGHLGSEAIAANSISNSIYQIVNVYSEGCASATAIIIAKIVGSGDLSKLKEQVRTLQVLFVVLGLLSGVTLFLLCTPVLTLYPQVDEKSLQLARQFILISCVTIIGTGYQVPCNCGIVRGGGDARFVLYMDLVLCWLYVAPVGLLAAFVWKLPTVWVFFLLKSDQLLKCIVAFVKTNRYKWIKVMVKKPTETIGLS